MEWTELTPLSTTNLNSLETRIANADAAVVAGKDQVYNAILPYGTTPVSKAFADLAAAISAMPIRGIVAATAQDVSGTTIRMRPPKGYYDGTASALVTATDSDFIAANISNTKNIFGLTGTAKRQARGTVLNNPTDTLTVTGLDFTPRQIAISAKTSGNVSFLVMHDPDSPYTGSLDRYIIPDGGTMVVTVTASSGGFSISNVGVGTNLTWFAME